MNSDSPMMHRVQRTSRKNGRLPTIPRKGRIRFILAILFVFLIFRIGPAVIGGISLPERPAPEKPVESKGPHKKNYPMLSIDSLRMLAAEIPDGSTSPNITIAAGPDSLTLFTGLDTLLQHYMAKLFRRYHPLYGAFVALDPGNGRILSLISYTGDSIPDLGGNLCMKAIFPAASIFKTVTAAAAVECAGYHADCMVEHKGKSHTLYRSQIAPELAWSADLPFYLAYARSINAVFARIGLYEIGATRLRIVARQFGFDTPVPGELRCEKSATFLPDSQFNCAELASGFNQRTTLSPLHGALIAAAIANDGMAPVPTLIDSIIMNRSGKKIYQTESDTWCRMMQPSTSRELQEMMRAVVRRGTAHKQFRYLRNSPRFDDHIYGGKTGSIDKDGIGRVDWFVGFACHPQLPDERIAVAALTVHGQYWTVHSSFLAAEAFRKYLRSAQKKRELAEKNDSTAVVADTTG